MYAALGVSTFLVLILSIGIVVKGNHEDDKDQTINDLQLQNKSYADQIDSANASIADLEGQVE